MRLLRTRHIALAGATIGIATCFAFMNAGVASASEPKMPHKMIKHTESVSYNVKVERHITETVHCTVTVKKENNHKFEAKEDQWHSTKWKDNHWGKHPVGVVSTANTNSVQATHNESVAKTVVHDFKFEEHTVESASFTASNSWESTHSHHPQWNDWKDNNHHDDYHHGHVDFDDDWDNDNVVDLSGFNSDVNIQVIDV